MPAIATSTVATSPPETDGRFWTAETHTDTLGLLHIFRYLAAVGTNVNTVLSARAAQLNIDIPAAEIATNINAVMTLGSLATPTFNFSTAAQNASALRAAYQTATQLQAVMIGDFLSTLTDVQLENAFSLTQAQVTTLRTNKLTPAANIAASIRANTGQ